MTKFVSLLSIFIFISCSNQKIQSFPQPNENLSFDQVNGCILLYNLKTNQFEVEMGKDRCKEQTSPASSFKVPLSLMAFDAQVLKDENSMLNWDGSKQMIKAWEADQTAASWMKESVVWYSQRLTKKIGRKKMQVYLNKLNYGNKDFSGGLINAWLPANRTSIDGEDSIKINAYEQIEFMKNFWNESYKLNPRAYELTKKITYIETSPKGYAFHGKTGSGFVGPNFTRRLGWFIAHIGNKEKSYVAVTTFTDKEELENPGFGGRFAREVMKEMLKVKGLW